ncbi:arabinogalactan endo-1,4-beta-galactosidase [Agarivorans albus MKT 106]|uniref:Arabinogalactan endo-beta-1,4-galactanase n=1 Tax=Agarivorans albus MKT 106 TaxID=1331007 RepID=R9PMN0_AGAAL|nr:glycosyl hydrolase 53 family protein [Agarivorans albus]GAD02647.1 arabinogalactan endo-1,4-beta-galactosidase [Agarivorans albus MKT 106]
MNSRVNTALLFMVFIVAGCQSANQPTSSDNNASITAPDLRDNFIRGMDISMLPEIEALGGKYYQNSIEQDLVTILKNHGVNSIRARLWVDPSSSNGEPFGGWQQ